MLDNPDYVREEEEYDNSNEKTFRRWRYLIHTVIIFLILSFTYAKCNASCLYKDKEDNWVVDGFTSILLKNPQGDDRARVELAECPTYGAKSIETDIYICEGSVVIVDGQECTVLSVEKPE